jgi:hypothetical protein
MDGISSLHCVECNRCSPAPISCRIVQTCVTSATECEALATDFCAQNNHKFFVSMIAALSRFVGHGRGALAHALSAIISLETINLSDTLGVARNSDSKIQHQKGWIRSSRTIAIRNRQACFCFRMQPAGVEQGSLHAALLSHSERFWLVSQERALRQAPLCLPHRVATRARRAWLPGSPCVRALATRVLRAWPL